MNQLENQNGTFAEESPILQQPHQALDHMTIRFTKTYHRTHYNTIHTQELTDRM